MRARLISKTGPCPGLSFNLKSSTMTIGRVPGTDIVVPSPEVSREHARIVFENGRYYIEDLKSTNGTYLNTMEVARESLNHLDVITFGKTTDFIVLLRESDEAADARGAEIAEATFAPEGGGAASLRLTKPVTTVGRAAPSDFIIDDPSVSKQHAQIERQPDRIRLMDLGSANGTFVNGNRITTLTLEEGDVVAFAGSPRFTLQLVKSMAAGSARPGKSAGKGALPQALPPAPAAEPELPKTRIGPIPQAWADAARGKLSQAEPPAPAAEPELPKTRIGPIPQAWADAAKGTRPPPPPPAPGLEPIPPTVTIEALRDSGAGPESPPTSPAPRAPVLAPFKGDEGRKAIDLKPGVSTVGRTDDRDIVIDDHRISRLHATFHVDEYVVLLTDEGSANGTYVNDERIKWRELKEGDVIRFGAVLYRLTFRPK